MRWCPRLTSLSYLASWAHWNLEVCTHCSWVTPSPCSSSALGVQAPSTIPVKFLCYFHILNLGLLSPPVCSIWPGFLLLHPWNSLFSWTERLSWLSLSPAFFVSLVISTDFFYCSLLLNVGEYIVLFSFESCNLWPLCLWLLSPWKPISVVPPSSEACISNSWNPPSRGFIAISFPF